MGITQLVDDPQRAMTYEFASELYREFISALFLNIKRSLNLYKRPLKIFMDLLRLEKKVTIIRLSRVTCRVCENHTPDSTQSLESLHSTINVCWVLSM